MPRLGKSHVNQSISFPPKLLADSKVRAKNLGLSLSAFVQKCLDRDLSDRPDTIYKESGGATQTAVEPPPATPDTSKPKKARR
jgi:hypothetical protein